MVQVGRARAKIDLGVGTHHIYVYTQGRWELTELESNILM